MEFIFAGECKDTRPDCLALARSGYCGTHEDDMRQTCGKTCQFCGELTDFSNTNFDSFQLEFHQMYRTLHHTGC